MKQFYASFPCIIEILYDLPRKRWPSQVTTGGNEIGGRSGKILWLASFATVSVASLVDGDGSLKVCADTRVRSDKRRPEIAEKSVFLASYTRVGASNKREFNVVPYLPTMANLRQTPLTCSGHTRPVVHLAFSDITESGYYLISACKDGKPMLRQGDTGDWIGTFEGHKGAVWGVALNPQATRAASGAADFNAKVWDAIKGEEIHSFQHKHIVKSVNFSTDSNHLCTGSNEKLVRIYDLNKPEAAPQIFSGHKSGIRHVTFFNNNTSLITCGDDKTLRVWDRNSGQEVKRLDFPAIPNSMEISKDGNIITTTHSNIVTFWNSRELTKLREHTAPTQMNSASLHPDCSIFVCGGEDLKMYKFDYATGTEIESFKGHFGPVHCVRFSPDGELYASGSEDGTLRLWQTTVGKTYGLWRCIEQTPVIQENTNVINNKQEVPAS